MAGAKRFTEGRYLCENGSSWMQLVAFQGGKVQAQTILPFGNSNNAASPHYADQLEMYTSFGRKPLWHDALDVNRAAKSVERLRIERESDAR